MKTLQTEAVAISLLTLFSSCQSTSAQMKNLSNKETRKEMMNTLKDNPGLMQNMMSVMMEPARVDRNDKNCDGKPANDVYDAKHES